jgi:hypothetical protein
MTKVLRIWCHAFEGQSTRTDGFNAVTFNVQGGGIFSSEQYDIDGLLTLHSVFEFGKAGIPIIFRAQSGFDLFKKNFQGEELQIIERSGNFAVRK